MFFKKTDIITIAIIITLSVVALAIYKFAFSSTPAKAEIYYYSQLVETVDLSSGVEKDFSLPQKPNVVFHLSKDGYISFKKSDCRDKVCVNSGKHHIIGETAACLPNGLILKIVSVNPNDNQNIDIIAK